MWGNSRPRKTLESRDAGRARYFNGGFLGPAWVEDLKPSSKELELFKSEGEILKLWLQEHKNQLIYLSLVKLSPRLAIKLADYIFPINANTDDDFSSFYLQTWVFALQNRYHSCAYVSLHDLAFPVNKLHRCGGFTFQEIPSKDEEPLPIVDRTEIKVRYYFLIKRQRLPLTSRVALFLNRLQHPRRYPTKTINTRIPVAHSRPRPLLVEQLAFHPCVCFYIVLIIFPECPALILPPYRNHIAPKPAHTYAALRTWHLC